MYVIIKMPGNILHNLIHRYTDEILSINLEIVFNLFNKIDLKHFESFLTKTLKYTSFLIYIKKLNKIINCF